MKINSKKIVSILLSFIMLLQVSPTIFAANNETADFSGEVPTAVSDGNYFYLQSEKDTVSETDTKPLRIKVGRSGDTGTDASVTLKIIDISASVGENYTVYIEGDNTAGFAEYGNVSVVDFALENEEGFFEQELLDENELGEAVNAAGGVDILDSEGNVIGRTTATPADDEGSEVTISTAVKEEDEEVAEVTEAEQTSEEEISEEEAPAEENIDIPVIEEKNPLKAGRNKYTGTYSDRQPQESDVDEHGILFNQEEDDGIYTDNEDAAPAGEIVQDEFPGTEYLLDFKAGESEKYIVITPKYSVKNDGDGIFTCMLKGASEGMLIYDDMSNKSITIADADGPVNATITMKEDHIYAKEGKAYVEINREGAINNMVYATIYTVPKSAETGKDFSGVRAKVYFPMGIKTRLVEIPVGHGDTEKDFYVKINQPVGCEIKNNSTLVTIPTESFVENNSDAQLMDGDFEERTLVSGDRIASSFDISRANFYGNTSYTDDGCVLMSGEGQKNDTYHSMQITNEKMRYLYDGIRIKWGQSHKMLISFGYEVITQIYSGEYGRKTQNMFRSEENKFQRIDDYFFGNAYDTTGVEIGSVTTSWHGRRLSVYDVAPIKRDFTFKLLPPKTPEEGGLDFVGCTKDEIAENQHVIMNSSLTATSCTIKSNEAFSVSATGEEKAKFTGVEVIMDNREPYFIPATADTRTVTIVANDKLINDLGQRGYITFKKNSAVNEKSFKGEINIRPVFEYIDATVEILHTNDGHFEGYETNGNNNLIEGKFHMGDKLTLKGVTGKNIEATHRPLGISYTEKDSKNADNIKNKGTVAYVENEESRQFEITEYYTSLKPTFTKITTNTIVSVPKEDIQNFNTKTGIFAMAKKVEEDESGNVNYYISMGNVPHGYLYMLAETTDKNKIALWREENDLKEYSGDTFYFKPDLYIENNYVYLSVSEKDNAYFSLSGYVDAPNVNLSTGHIIKEREYPAAEALICAGGSGAVSDNDGNFVLDPVYGTGGKYLRYLVTYNGISEVREAKLPSISAPSETVTYKYWDGVKYADKTVNSIKTELGVVMAPGHISSGVRFDSVNVIQGEHYILGAQIVEMNGLETKFSVTVKDGYKYTFEGNTYSENVTAVKFMFMDGLTGEIKSEFPAKREGETNKWTVKIPRFTPDSPESFTYGDSLYVQMQTDKKLFVDEELKALGEMAPVMTYNPVATGYSVISDTTYTPQGFEFDVPLDASSIMGGDAELLEEKRVTYGTFPFLGEIKFAMGVVGILKTVMRDDDYADAMLDDLENMRGEPVEEDAHLLDASGGDNQVTSRKMTLSFAFRIKELPYGGTRLMVGVVGVAGNSTFETRANPYASAVTASDMFTKATRRSLTTMSKIKDGGSAIDKVNSMMGGMAFSFSIYLGLYLDFGYLNISETDDSEVTTISNKMVFLGGGGFCGGGVAADGMKPFVVPPGIPCYGGFVASASVTDFFGYSKDPARTLDSVQNSGEVNVRTYDLNHEFYVNGSLDLYAGAGLANILGLRVSIGAGVEVGVSNNMKKWFPGIKDNWGVNLIANVAGQVDLVFGSIPLVSFSFPLAAAGFQEYFNEVKIGNHLISLINTNVNQIVKNGQEAQYKDAIDEVRSVQYELQRMIDSNSYTAEEIKNQTDQLRKVANQKKILTGLDYYKSFTTYVGGVASMIFSEEEQEEGFYIRDHVSSKWVAGNDAQLMGAFEQVSSRKVIEDSYVQPSSKIISIGNGKMLMVYIGDDLTRNEIQAATLMYSIYDVYSDEWTEPQTIQDDMTADSSPDVCDAGDSIMISWISTNPAKVENSANPVDHYEKYDVFTCLFDKNSQTMGEIEQITNDNFSDSSPKCVYDPVTGDRQVFYVKSYAETKDEKQFTTVTDELMSFINPNVTYNVLCYMLYEKEKGEWARDFYYETEISRESFESEEEYREFVEMWQGQRFLPSGTQEYTDPLICDIAISEGSNGMGVYAYTIDMDGDPDTYEDKELYIQLHNFVNHTVYVPTRVTRDNIVQSAPKIISNGDSVYLFWLSNNTDIMYIDITQIVTGIPQEDGNSFATVSPNGNIVDNYTIDVHKVDAQSRYDGASISSIVDYQVLSDKDANLYVLWNRPVHTEKYSEKNDVNAIPPVEVYASAKIREDDLVEIEDSTYVRGGRWSKPHRLTHSETLNDGVAAALSDNGELVLMHNSYTMDYVGFNPEYFENYKIVTREDEQGNEQKFLEGQLYEMSEVDLMVTRCAAVGSLDVSDITLSDESPCGGDTIEVTATIENTGLTTAKGYEIKFYEYKGESRGKEIASFESDEKIGVNTSFVKTFSWTVPEDIEGVGILVEVIEKNDDFGYYPDEFVSETLKKSSDCKVEFNKVKQAGEKFNVDFTITNDGNIISEEGVSANIHLVGLYGDIETDYNMESDILSKVDLSGIEPGNKKEYSVGVEIPAVVFESNGFDAIEISVQDKDGKIIAHSDEKFVQIEAPMNFLLNGGKNIEIRKGNSLELDVSYDGGQFIQIAENIIYSVDDPDVAVINGSTLTAMGKGTTYVTATMMPYGISSTVKVTVSSGATSGGGGQSGSSSNIVKDLTTGAVKETIKNEDGSVVTITKEKDGSSKIEEVRKDGTTVTTEFAVNGEAVAEIKTNKAVDVLIPYTETEDLLMVKISDEKGKVIYVTEPEISEDGIKISTDKNVKVTFVTGEKKEFKDIHPVNHWSMKAVDFVSALEIMKGTGEDVFSPEDKLTRAMLVTVIYRMYGEPEVLGECKFEDVEKDSYYEKAVIWASENGIVNGVDEKSFAPDAFVTREMAAAMMHRFSQFMKEEDNEYSETNILSYDDFSEISNWAISSMQWACGAGVIKGRDIKTLAPLDNLTRAEAAQVLMNFMQK